LEYTCPITEKKYKIRALKFGEMNDIRDATGIADPVSGLLMPNTGTMMRMVIEKGVVEPEITRKELDAMDEDEGVELYRAILRLGKKAPLETSPKSG